MTGHSRVNRVVCIRCWVGTNVRIVECLGIGVGIGFDVGQLGLVKDHTYVLCGVIVEVETVVRTGTDTIGPLTATNRVHLARRVPGLGTNSFSKVVSIVGNLQHLHTPRHPELTDPTVSVHIASIPVLEGAFLGVVGRSGVEMYGFLNSRTY